MALSGIQIYKLLPQTNCKDCGFPTCLAFAMKLAAKQAELSLCEHVSEEAAADRDRRLEQRVPVRRGDVRDGGADPGDIAGADGGRKGGHKGVEGADLTFAYALAALPKRTKPLLKQLPCYTEGFQTPVSSLQVIRDRI